MIATGIALIIIFIIIGLNVLPIIFLFSILLLVKLRPETSGILDKFSKKQEENNIPTISFNEIGGQFEAKKELREALDFIKFEENVKSLGIRPLKGILLTGPPGTGKTLLAKAAAAETGSVFKAVSGSEFVEMYAGVGASRIRKLFKEARQNAKKEDKSRAIIFIDEIDILGGKRGQNTGHLEYDQTLNQLLVEMDGINSDAEVRILIIGATNRQDMLDEALLRPGRFDRILQVDLPNKEERIEILEIHTKNKPLASNVNLALIASATFGFSGAQLENLTNEAAIMALRYKEETIKESYFMEAVDKVILGSKTLKKSATDEKERVAFHEAGHALMAEFLKPGSVAKVTIVPRGRALGYVRHHDEQDKNLKTKNDLQSEISIATAGAVAEELIFNDRSTGASNDLKFSGKLIETLFDAGLTELGFVAKDQLSRNKFEEEVVRISNEVYHKVKNILLDNYNTLTIIAEKLLEDEYLSGDTLRKTLHN